MAVTLVVLADPKRVFCPDTWPGVPLEEWLPEGRRQHLCGADRRGLGGSAWSLCGASSAGVRNPDI